MEAYNHVSGTIQHVYQELTKSNDFPSGGKAYLTLDNNEVSWNIKNIQS